MAGLNSNSYRGRIGHLPVESIEERLEESPRVVAYADSRITVLAVNDGTDGNSVAVYGLARKAKSSAYGVLGVAEGNDGVQGRSNGDGSSGVAGIHESGGNGVYGRSAQGAAGYFDGSVTVTGTLTVNGDIVLPGGGDCAERFDVAADASVGPGSLVVLDRNGAVRESSNEYDTKLVGVVAGAGRYRPAIILDARASSQAERASVALFGKVYCKAVATDMPIRIGDLLTSSATPGCAMSATDPARAAGAIVGKALGGLSHGKGLIPMLVSVR